MAGRVDPIEAVEQPRQMLGLEVLALPPSPPDFTGAVGDLTVSARLDRSALAVGEAAALTIRAAGRGSLQGLRPPELSIPEGIRAFPPRQESAERLTDGNGVPLLW